MNRDYKTQALGIQTFDLASAFQRKTVRLWRKRKPGFRDPAARKIAPSYIHFSPRPTRTADEIFLGIIARDVRRLQQTLPLTILAGTLSLCTVLPWKKTVASCAAEVRDDEQPPRVGSLEGSRYRAKLSSWGEVPSSMRALPATPSGKYFRNIYWDVAPPRPRFPVAFVRDVRSCEPNVMVLYLVERVQ